MRVTAKPLQSHPHRREWDLPSREGMNFSFTSDGKKYFTKCNKEKKKIRLTFFIESLDPPPALDELQFPYKDGPQIHILLDLAIICNNKGEVQGNF